MPDTSLQPHHAGHRQRLRERFLRSKGNDLADYELIELLLFAAMPRRDVKPIAEALLKRFGSFAGVLNADSAELQKTDGIGEVAAVSLLAVRQAAVRLLQDDVMDQPVLGSWHSLMDYCRVSMGHNKTEQFRVLFLNRKNVLIADELQQEGTIDHTRGLSPRSHQTRARAQRQRPDPGPQPPLRRPHPVPSRHRNDERTARRRRKARHLPARSCGGE